MRPEITTQAAETRRLARNIFQHALEEASIERAFARHVSCERGVLRICDDLYDLESFGRVLVISIGKAADAMARALEDHAGSRFEGIVARPVSVEAQVRGFRYFQGGHPTPNPDSVEAARALLKSATSLDADSLVILMISGGGSSIAEKPFYDEVSLDDLIATYRVLVHSGAPIATINAIRKHLSAIKGGRLAQAAFPAQQVSLLISDVPENLLDALASGPTMPDSTSTADCYSIAAEYAMLPDFPPSVRELFARHALRETPKPDDPVFGRSRWWTLLSNQSAVQAASEAAARAGYTVEIDNTCDDWDYAKAADYLLDRLRALREESPRACLISGGEVTVKVTNGGVGGRNQQFALYCAEKIAGEDVTVLSAGTDGIDGNSSAAGAVVDGTTLSRAQERSLDAESSLKNFNAFPFFDSLGDAVVTGPTGNNLRDLRILLAT